MNRFRIAVLKDLLGISENTQYETDLLDRQNVVVGLIVSIFNSIAMILIMLASFFDKSVVLMSREGGVSLSIMRIPFVALLVFSCIYGFFAYSYFYRSGVTHRIVTLEINAYIFECIAFGIIVAHFDQPGFRGIILLIAEFIFCAAMFTLRPWTTLFHGAITFILFLLATDFYQTEFFLGMVLIFIFLIAICFVLSTVRYQEGIRSAVHNERLMDMNSELTYVSNHDYLTNLRNRHALSKEMRRFVKKDIYVLMTGVDDFTFFNDLYGHQAGDELLKQAAARLEECFEGDICYAYGDDVFLVIGTEKDREDFQRKLANWITYRECELNDLKVHFTVSGGYVYGKPESKKYFQDMLRQADIRLNAVRHQGKGLSRGFAYDPNMNPREILTMDIHQVEERQNTDVDILTGLPGMMYFVNKAGIVLNNFSGDEDRFAFLYLNVVGMNAYNDAHGFRAGDKLLKLVAQTLLDTFPHQLVSRFGEDRFVVLAELPDIHLKLTRLIHHIEEAAETSRVTMKAGIYVYEQGTDVDRCCDRAKLACQSIHDAYDVSCAFFEERMESTLRKRKFYVDNLSEAIKKGRIYPHYQPVVDTKTEKIASVEALSRWNDPIYGLENPEEFVPVLENAHIIHKLDLCIIRRVAEDLKNMTEEGLSIVPVSINLSPLDFSSCDIVTEADHIIKSFDVDPKWIRFEVTESGIGGDDSHIRREMKRLRMLGYQVWMDDFGSAYSSLNTLKDYDFDVLKLDMNFLSGFSGNEKSKTIISSVIHMAQDLNMRTLAEGVEKVEQRDYLQSVGCDYIQGFYYSRPLTLRELRKYLAKNQETAE